MPEYDDIVRAAAAAATPPEFDELAGRGVRRRRRVRAGYAAVVALAVVGALGLAQVLGGDRDRTPGPAPDPEPSSGLVLTREDGTTFAPVDLAVACTTTGLVEVTGAFEAEGTDVVDPERSEQAFAGGFRLRVAAAPDGGSTDHFPDPTLDREPGITVVDPASGASYVSEAEEAADGRLDVTTASCSPTRLELRVTGVLGSSAGGAPATLRIAGGLDLEAEPAQRPVPRRATAIVDHPRSTLDALAVSAQDPDVQAASWRLCDDAGCARPRWAVVVSGDGFRTRTVLPGVHEYRPELDAAGQHLLVHPGDSMAPRLFRPDGSAAEPGTGPATGHLYAYDLGSGRHIPVLLDVENAVVTGLRPGGEAEGLFQMQRLSDDSLAAIADDHAGAGPAYATSTDDGATWRYLPLDAPVGALHRIVDVPGGAVLEGADATTLFPLVAVHRLVDGELVRSELPGGRRPLVQGHAVLADGRLLVAVADWSDATPPGLYASTPEDWTDLSRVATGAPFDGPRSSVTLLDVVEVHGTPVLYAAAPAGEETPAYRSDDGGRGWVPVPAR